MSKRAEKLGKILHKMFEEAYREATPSADYNELLELYGGTDTVIYDRYYLSNEKFEEIFEKHTKGLKGSELSSMTFAYYLGATPSGKKERVHKRRLELGLEGIL